MHMRGLRCSLMVVALAGGASHALAGFVPVATSYSLDASARVAATAFSLEETRSVSLTSPALLSSNVSFNEFRTATARLRVIASDAGTEQMARYTGGLSGSADSSRIASSTWVQGRHDGIVMDGAGISREVDALARVRFEFIVDSATSYRFTGLPGGQSEAGPFDGLPISDVTIAFWAPTGVLHEFQNIDFQRSPTGGFDVTGVLTPGLYAIDATARVRMGLGNIPANDPYTAMLDFELLAVPGPGPLAMVGLAVFAGSRRKR
jgi:hypothetical protein